MSQSKTQTEDQTERSGRRDENLCCKEFRQAQFHQDMKHICYVFLGERFLLRGSS